MKNAAKKNTAVCMGSIMQEYIIELSKYFITLCITLYAYECFAVFRFKEENKRGGIYTRQIILIFFIQFFCFLSLCIKSGKTEYLFFYAFVQLFLFSAIVIVRMIYQKANRLLLNNMCLLLGTGFVILSRISLNKAVKQYIIVIFSLLISLSIPYLMVKLTFLKKITWLYAMAGVLALSIVLILGEVTYGSKIFFSVGGLSFQPSEFVKILFVFFMAAALWEETSFKRVALTALCGAVHVIILVVSKDLGSALIFFAAYVFLVFLATKNYWYLLAGAVGGCLASVLAYQIFDHVKIRVLAWQDPWTYIDNQGYQITQSLFAIGSGNWLGMGLYGGTPGDIPFVEADFIFSAVCEELGVIYGLCILLICISCFVMMMNIAVQLKDRFYQLIASGLGIIYIFQIFLTIGGGTKFIPLTGVTLPFVSYGGSSVLTTMMMFFIMQGIYVRKQQEGGKLHVSQEKGNTGRTKTERRKQKDGGEESVSKKTGSETKIRKENNRDKNSRDENSRDENGRKENGRKENGRKETGREEEKQDDNRSAQQP